MAVIDVAGYVADLKDHSVDHGFHVHDERHFVETYSLRQVWEVELHPEDGCGGPLDLHLALEVDPRTLLSFEDAVFGLPEDEDPPDEYHFPLTFTWALPPLPNGPDLLRLAIDLAGVGGIELPLEVSAIDSYASATDAAERRLTIVARSPVSLARILAGEEMMCEVFDRCLAVSRYLLDPPVAGSGDWCRRRSPSSPLGQASAPRALPPHRRRGAERGLAACSNGGAGLARQACGHVDQSLTLFKPAEDAPTRPRPIGWANGPTWSCATPSPLRPRPRPVTASSRPS